MVKRSHLKDLDHGQAHFGRQGHEVAFKQGVVVVVETVQVLDQQVTPITAWGWQTGQCPNLGQRLVSSLATFELRPGLAQLRPDLLQVHAGFSGFVGLHVPQSIGFQVQSPFFLERTTD